MSDVVVIGGGHNGLVAAALLAKAGRTVTVVERGMPGGIAGGAEFHPGYRHAGIWHEDRVRPWVLSELGLDVSLRDRPALVGPDGAALDSPALRAAVDATRPFLLSVLDNAAPEVSEQGSFWPLLKTGLGLRRMGGREMLDVLRVFATAVGDYAEELTEDVRQQALICAEALPGTWMGSRSPLSTAILLIREALAGREVVGGPAALVDSLTTRVPLTAGEVTRIRVEGGTVKGVELADGSAIDAGVVLSAIGPKRTFRLVPPRQVPDLVARDIDHIRTRGIVAKLHLALSAPLEVAGRSVERLSTASHPLDLERSFDAAKHRRLPVRPTLDVRQRTDGAPPGHAVASVVVHGAAHGVHWDEAARAGLLEAALTSLEAVVPDVRDRIEGHQLLTPDDLEAQLGLDGGHLLHGELSPDQMWSLRPLPMLSRHATPIRGLFLGSNGTHPGVGVTGAPGALAAKAVLRA
jgi:phytoene dehydrogenase-like protein